MADSQANRGLLGMQRRTWGALVVLTIVLLLGAIFYFYPRTLEVRGASLGSTFTADAQLIVRDKIDQTVVKVVPVSKVVSSVQSGYTIKYSPSWFEFPRRLSVDVCFARASVVPATTTLPEHVYCQKPVEKVAYMCDDHNVWTQYFSTTQVADLRAYCGETKPSAAAPTTPVVAGEKSDAPAVTNYYTTTGGTNTTVNNEIDMPECDSDEILVWDNGQWNCRDQATVVPVTTTYPSCAPGEVLTSVAGVLGCTSVAAAAYPNCAANETLTSTAGVLSCTPDYTWTANSNIGAAIPVADGDTVKFTSSNGTIVTTSSPGNILEFDVQVDSSTPNNALVINGALGLYVPAGLSSITAGLGLTNSGTALNPVIDAQVRNGLSINSNFIELGGPVGAAGAATLLSNREIPQAGFDMLFSGAGQFGIGTTTPDFFSKVNIVNPTASQTLLVESNTAGNLFAAQIAVRNIGPAGQASRVQFYDGTVLTAGIESQLTGAGPDGNLIFDIRNNSIVEEAMRINSVGNVGINDTNPVAKLSIGIGTTGAAGTAGLNMVGVGGAPALSLGNSGRIYFDLALDKFRCSENNGAYFNCFNSNTVASVNAGLGLINVGTASAVDLDVRARSGVSLQGDFVHLGDPTAGPAAAPLLYDTNINYGGNTLQLAGANTVFSASTSGLRPQGLGFNTNVQINGSGSEGIWFTDNSSGAGYGSFIFQENLGAGSMNMGTFNGGPYRFYTNNTERARFSGGGQFGLGITNPLAILDVAGAGAGGDAGMQLRGVATAPALSTASAGRVFYNSTTNTFQCSLNNGAYTDCMSGTLNAANNGLLVSGTTVQLGGPVGAAGAATLLSNREIPTAGFDTAFSGTGRLALGTNTIPAIGGAGPGNVFITSNSGNGTFYSARYENPGADDTGLKVFSNTNAIVARFGFYPGFAGNYALAVADQGDMMFGTNAAGGTTRFLAAGNERMWLSPQGNLSIGNPFALYTPLAKLHLQGGTTGAAGTAGFMMEGVAAQPALSIANAGKMYFDSTLDKFRCSENAGAYSDCFNSSALTNANNGLSVSGTTAQLGGNLIQNTNVTNNGFDLGFVGSAQTNTYTSTGAAVFNGTTATAGKVATFVGDIDVTGTIDPTRILFSNLAGVNSPSYNPSANSNNYSMRFEEGGNLNFQSDTTNDILHLSNSGLVGIGTGTPTSILDVAGTGAGGNAGINLRGVAAAPALSASNQGRFFYNSTTNTFQCSTNGGSYADCMGGTLNAANNGLSVSGTTVQLGGNLIMNTTINGASTYGIALDNLSSLTASTSNLAVTLDGSKFIYNVDGDPTNGLNANTFYGYRAGESFASTSLGSANTVFGTKAGRLLNGSYASASSNAFFGYGAGENLTTGTLNTLLGVVAGGNVTNAGVTGMVGVGHHALLNNSGSNVIGIGRNALQDNTQSDIIGIGLYALKSNTGIGNVGIGQYTQQNNTIGTKNTTLGWGAMQNFLAGQAGITSNVAIGYNAMGAGAGGGAAGGGYNTVVGTEAGKAMLLGNSNTLLGNNSGNSLTNGSYNVFLGNNAGAVGAIVNTGSLNVIIGNGQVGNALSASTASNELAIAGAIFGEATYSANPRIGLGKFPNDRSILDLGGSANSLILPKGTTVSQPAVTLEDGMIRFDTDKQNISMYSSQSGSWLGLYQKTYTQSTTSATGDLLGSFDHTIILDASSNNIVQSVPAALPQYKDWELRYRAKNASTNNITILGAANNISYNGSLVTSIPMYDGEEVNMYSDGTLWYATKVTHLTVNNGLTASGTLAELGGNLLHNTAIANNGFNLNISGSLSTTTFASNGNVGIGTTTPDRPLAVMANPGSSTNGIVLIRNGGTPAVAADRRIELINNAADGGQIDTYDATGAPVTRLRNNANNFVVANDNANFGIGTTNPLNRLHVRQGILGSFTAQIENFGNGVNSHGLLISAGGDVNTGSQMIEFRRPDGTVIGSVNQDTAASVAFNTTSDRRLKENIVDTSLGLDTLMKLQVHDYNYISDSTNTQMQGFIAQELNDVYSQAVTVGGSNAKTNPWQVDYSKLTPLLTKSIQDLEVKKANKNEIADLNANDENFISELSGILDTTSAQKESIEKLLATLEALKLDVAALQDTVKSIVAALDQDQFGQIKIKKGDTKGTVEFADKLSRTPVVNITPHDFVSKGYAIKNITDRGFEIRLQEEQDDDITFDWRAVAAREVEYNTSSTGGSTDSTPADDEESDSEEETPVVEEEVTPEETPVVEEEAPVTDEGGSDTGETPAEEPAIPSGI